MLNTVRKAQFALVQSALGTLTLIETARDWYMLVSPTGTVLREGGLQRCTATWLAYEAATDNLLEVRSHDRLLAQEVDAELPLHARKMWA